MDKDISVLKRFAEYAFSSLERTCEGITETEADWKQIEESNDVRWILNHLSRITNISLPRIFKGDPDYLPEDWPSNYRDQHYSLEKLLEDIQNGKKVALDFMEKLNSESLSEDIPLWGGTRKREFGIFAYIGEIISHRGQIAAIKGNIKRRREKDSSFLK
jgi:hypothetical protein